MSILCYKSGFNDVDSLLEQILLSLKAIFDTHLLAVYLYGSLTTGDFQYVASDVDVLVITKDKLSGETVKTLDKFHHRLVKDFPSWENRIEIAYFSKGNSKTIKMQKGELAIISPGEPFNRKPVGNDWIINAYLIQNSGVVLYGSQPKDVIEKITKPEFLQAVKQQAIQWNGWIENTKLSTAYQYYAVLTLCRILYILKNGDQVSKIRASEWAIEYLPKWSDLIKRAENSYRVNFTNINEEPSDLYPSVVEFVNEIGSLLGSEVGDI